MIDLTPVGHALIAMSLQIICGLLLADWSIGALIGCTFFLAREHTQAEYRWIAKYGKGKRANMPWYGGFDYKAWDLDSVLDCAVPVFACATIYFIME